MEDAEPPDGLHLSQDFAHGVLARYGGARKLNLARNQVRTLSPRAFSLLGAALAHVDLSRNALDGAALRALDAAHLPRLATLRLARNRLETLAHLSPLPPPSPPTAHHPPCALPPSALRPPRHRSPRR